MPQTDQGLDKNEVERLKTALCDSIVKIVQEETLKLEATATPQFVNALLEVAWSHLDLGEVSFLLGVDDCNMRLAHPAITDTSIETTIADVEAFSRHAGRSTITPADVLMLCRRNEGLNQTLRSYQEHLESERQENS
ncbi:hypothetical protein N7456_012814 [Penicillium angulare]|uniref:Centromere protein S n=1 Tax=Penicillium angulare TaxID=116970 RepID=A0A9W9JW72_9EURO|nr:hypothetical protein N7456_012814 [Penicillium angulare]